MVGREHRVDVGQVELTVTEAGPADGPPVLLLHGFPDSRHLWTHQIDALAAAGHRVIAPDLRGFGDSDRPEAVDAYAMPLLVADLVGLLDRLGVQQAAVVGHDWGSILGWAFTSAHPERVRRLVAVSVGHPAARAGAGIAQHLKGAYVLVFLVPGLAERLLPAARWFWLRRFAWGGADPASTPALARQIADLSRPGALPAALAWYRANVPLPRLPRLPRPSRGSHGGRPAGGDGATGRGRSDGPRARRLPRRRIEVPVMGVWSSGDPVLTERQMTGSARLVGGPWRYERIQAAGHWVPVAAAEQLSALLVDHLRVR